LIDTRIGRESIAWGTYEGSLADAILDPARTTPSDEPAYLVCTQGRHDQCCAIDGRPVAAALALRWPQRTWECTHVGGDRFAANVIVLPHGLTYGHLDAQTAISVVTAYAQGAVVPELLRGRMGIAPAGQYVVAEVHRRMSNSQTADILAVNVSRDGLDRWTVEVLTRRGTSWTGRVREHHEPVSSRLTCNATGPGVLRSFQILSLAEGPNSAARGLDGVVDAEN
jgi:hypothetical protein